MVERLVFINILQANLFISKFTNAHTSKLPEVGQQHDLSSLFNILQEVQVAYLLKVIYLAISNHTVNNI